MAAVSLLQLSPTDTFRGERIVPLNGVIERILFAIKEFFGGGWIKRDLEAFAHDVYPILRERIDRAAHQIPSTAAFRETQELLRIRARISISSWGQTLKLHRSPEFEDFSRRLREIQRKIQKNAYPLLTEWIQGTLEQNTIARWILASEGQCEFAAYLNLPDVPYRFHEISKGSVLITDPTALLLHFQLSQKKSLFRTILMKIKAFICQFFTGWRFTHADLSLGNSETFVMDKRKAVWLHGEGMILNWGPGKVFYGTVVAPQKEMMLQAYNERFPANPCRSFDELWKKIDAEAREAAPKIRNVNLWHISRTGLKKRRPPDYDCTKAWHPETDHYGCSATISALYGKFGIDIGQQFSKIEENVTPVDFFHSRFFTPMYVIGN